MMRNYNILSELLDADIARYGTMHSFMIRAGLLREILDALPSPSTPPPSSMSNGEKL